MDYDQLLTFSLHGLKSYQNPFCKLLNRKRYTLLVAESIINISLIIKLTHDENLVFLSIILQNLENFVTYLWYFVLNYLI